MEEKDSFYEILKMKIVSAWIRTSGSWVVVQFGTCALVTKMLRYGRVYYRYQLAFCLSVGPSHFLLKINYFYITFAEWRLIASRRHFLLTVQYRFEFQSCVCILLIPNDWIIMEINTNQAQDLT